MGKPNRSKAKRVQKQYPGDGCWHCSPWTRVLKWRKKKYDLHKHGVRGEAV